MIFNPLYCLAVLLLQIGPLLVIVLLNGLQSRLKVFFQCVDVALGIPDTTFKLNYTVLQLLFQHNVILSDMLKRVFNGEDAMGTVLAISVGAVDAKELVFGEAVEGQNVIVVQAPHCHLVATHQSQQLGHRLQLFVFPPQFSSLSL
jgi:hypothetical protein